MKKSNAQQKAVIYTLPKNYIERQRIIKALQYPPYELVMWYYHKPKEDAMFLYGVYLKTDNTICCYYYDIKTLERLGIGYNPEKPKGEEFIMDINDIYRWLHKKHEVTDLLGFVLGVQSRPPKLEKKIIQFPVTEAQSQQRSTA
jgi:hypothetical protein